MAGRIPAPKPLRVLSSAHDGMSRAFFNHNRLCRPRENAYLALFNILVPRFFAI